MNTVSLPCRDLVRLWIAPKRLRIWASEGQNVRSQRRRRLLQLMKMDSGGRMAQEQYQVSRASGLARLRTA